MQGQILPYLSLEPYENRIQLCKPFISLLNFPEIRAGSTFGATQTRNPARNIHFLDGYSGRFHLQNCATSVGIGFKQSVGDIGIIGKDA